MGSTRYHHGDLRRALVSEGLILAEGQGAQAVTVRAIARRVGVSHAAAYRHFRSHRDLLASVASEAMNRLAEAQERAALVDPPSERLARLAGAYVQWAVSNPGGFRVAFSEELWDKDSLPELREASDRASRPVLDAASEHLGPSASEVQRRGLAVAVWAQAHGFAVLSLDRQLIQGELRVTDEASGDLPDAASTAVRVLVSGWPGRS